MSAALDIRGQLTSAVAQFRASTLQSGARAFHDPTTGKLSTELLLTSPLAFGITTATNAQRAACRIIDGAPLAELATDPDVITLVGGEYVIGDLPDAPPSEVVLLAAIRSAKTIIACAAALRMALTVNVSRLGPGEVPRVSLLSLALDASGVSYRLLLETIKASTALAPLLHHETADTLTLRHPSGRPIEIKTVAGSKAGGSLVARWSAGVVFDEAPRMSGAADAVINLDDARTAVQGRMLPGAQILYIGSPWAPYGPVYDMVTKHWQTPSGALVVLRGTGPMLNPTWWTEERCRELEQRNPAAYMTDVLGEFADPESGLLSPLAVNRNMREAPDDLPAQKGVQYTAAVDPSEGAADGNGFALALVQTEMDGDLPMVRTVLVREWRGLSPDACWREIAAVLRPYAVNHVYTDQYAASANADIALTHGLKVTVEKATAMTKLEDFTNLATLLQTDRLELPPDQQLRADLISVRKRTTQQGMSIVLPRTRDGRHADKASALVGAVKHTSAADPEAWKRERYRRALKNY